MDEGLKDSYDVYAEFFDDESSQLSTSILHSDLIDLSRVEVKTGSRWNLWGRAKKIFVRAKQTRQGFQLLDKAKVSLRHPHLPEQIVRLGELSCG